MNPYKYKISIRLRHASLSLTKISQQIFELLPGILLEKVNNVGEGRVTPIGRKLYGHYTDSYFSFAFSVNVTSVKEKSLEEAISDTIGKLEPCDKLLQAFVKSGGSIEFFIGIFIDGNSGIVLDPKLIQRLAESHVEIQLDIYPCL